MSEASANGPYQRAAILTTTDAGHLVPEGVLALAAAMAPKPARRVVAEWV